jgi:hypothetical protein
VALGGVGDAAAAIGSKQIVTLHYVAEEQTDGLGSVNDCFFVGSAAQSD